MAETVREVVDAWANDICRAVCELPDRTSPEDQPLMLLVTTEELHSIVVEAWNRRPPDPAVTELVEALTECLAADDAMVAFLLVADPKVVGESKWSAQHIERSARRRRATGAARALLAKHAAKP